jgi:hypothetical protein
VIERLSGLALISLSRRSYSLIDFFRYFAREFPYNSTVASIRAGLLKKAEKGWQNDVSKALCMLRFEQCLIHMTRMTPDSRMLGRGIAFALRILLKLTTMLRDA